MQSVYLVSAMRSAIGTFGGALKDVAPSELGAKVAKAAVASAGIDSSAVEFSIFGQVISTDAKDPYLARVVALDSGLSQATPAITVNRLCGSGMQAVIQGANLIQLGEVDVVLAGGAECMSRAPHQTQDVRWGRKMGQIRMSDMLEEGLKDPFHAYLMGVTAENVARAYQVDRPTQDALALESHRRASKAIREGRFAEQIVPIDVVSRRATRTFAEDEHVRHDAEPNDLEKLRAVFDSEGTVTAGNSSGINDGAAAVVLASERAVRTHGRARRPDGADWQDGGRPGGGPAD
ncbi:MAG: acetyl-CoA C-acyltransferase, partial [Pseudomonadota bacterium]